MKAVIAESFERIHRSNLVNMGVLPLQFKLGDNAASLKITGTESFRLTGVADGLRPRGDVLVVATEADGSTASSPSRFASTRPRNSSPSEHGGILPYVVRQLVGKS